MNYKLLISFILIFFFFESILLSKDKKYEKLYLKGNEFFKIGEFDDAITYFKKAINLNSSYCPAIYKLGLSYKKLYDFKNFVKTFENYENLLCEKFDDEVKFQLGGYYFLNGKISLSKKYLNGIDEKENFPMLFKYLINISYYLNHQFDSSLYYLESKSSISNYTFQYSPFINSSLNRIYFTGRAGMNLFDDEDIFYVEKDKYDNWEIPNKLSSKINTQNNEMIAYVNGIIVGNFIDNHCNSVGINHDDLLIGHSHEGGYLMGKIDEFVVYNNALGNNNVIELYNNGAGKRVDETTFGMTNVIYYNDMDVLTDMSGNGNYGAANGNPTQTAT